MQALPDGPRRGHNQSECVHNNQPLLVGYVGRDHWTHDSSVRCGAPSVLALTFGKLAPETNSQRMFCGVGAGSLHQAATAWDQLSADLVGLAAHWREITALAEAAEPYIGWLTDTADLAKDAAAQASAAASAYESALSTMVPPEDVATNRSQRMLLVVTNILGHAGPAIAALDDEYEQMWATDADAMYAYATASAAASTVTPFASPPAPPGAPAATDAPAATGATGTKARALTIAPTIISSGAQLVSTIPKVLQALSLSPLTSFATSMLPLTTPLSKLALLNPPPNNAICYLNALNKKAALASLSPGPSGLGDAEPTAKLGRGQAIGTLSVPPSWLAETRHPLDVPSGFGWAHEPMHLIVGRRSGRIGTTEEG